METESPHPNVPHAHHVDSEIYFDGRPSILLLFPKFLKAMIPVALGVIAAWFIEWRAIFTSPLGFVDNVRNKGEFLQPLLIGAVLLSVVVTFIFTVYVILMWLSTRYRITSDRIEYERGILSKKVLNVELWRVRDIFFHRNILHFFLGLGVIDILATDETIPKLEIGPIHGARRVYDQLKQARLRSGRLAGAQAMGMSN